MGKLKDFDVEHRGPIVDDETQEALAATEEGIRDADAGRTSPIDEARILLP